MLEDYRAVVAKPGEDVFGEIASMSAGFNYLDRTRPGLALCKPLHELKCEQLAEKISDADAGVKVSISPNRVLFLFIKSINGTIKGQAHEFFEWDSPPLFDLGRNYFNELIQRLGELVRI